MIFEYTDEEKQRLMDVDAYYAALLDEVDADLLKQKEGSKAYRECAARHIELEDRRIGEYSALYDEFEKARFDALGGDLDAILANGKEQAKLIVESTYERRKEVNQALNATGAFDKPQDENPLIESQDALAMIRRGLRLHFEALDESRSKALHDYAISYISASPYTYTDTARREAPEINPDAEIAEIMRRPLAPIKTYGFLNDKVDKAILGADVVEQEANGQLRLMLGANQAPAGKPEVPVYIAMRYEGEEIRIAKRITAFDAAVYNAVSTLYYYHRLIDKYSPLYVTPQEVWRTMNGIKDSRKAPTAKQIAAVCKSLDKMRYTNFYMDISAEIKAHYITFNDERVTEGHIDTYMLKAEKVAFKTEKGQTVTGYRIDNEPILYSYNAAKNHVLFVDYDLLDTSDQTGNEGYTVEFRSYLLQQIEMMINGTRNNRLIKYETIYRDTAIPAPADRINRKDYTSDHAYKNTIYREAQKDRQKIAALLESWVAKKWIKGYEPAPAKKGRGTIGVEIKLYAKKDKPKEIESK